MTNNQLSAGQPLPAALRRPDWRAFRTGLPLALAFASFLYSLACVLSQGRLPTDLGQTALRALLLGACWWAVLPLLWQGSRRFAAESFAGPAAFAGPETPAGSGSQPASANASATATTTSDRAGTKGRPPAARRVVQLLAVTALALLLAASAEWLLHRAFGIRAVDADSYGLLAEWLRHLHRRLPLALAIAAGLLWWQQGPGRRGTEPAGEGGEKHAAVRSEGVDGVLTRGWMANPEQDSRMERLAVPGVAPESGDADATALAGAAGVAVAATAGAVADGVAAGPDAAACPIDARSSVAAGTCPQALPARWTLNTLLPAMTGTGRCPVPLARVLVLKAAQNYVELQLTDGRQLLLRSTLRELLASLPAEHFRQVHRSWVVRLDAIDSVLPRRHVRLHGGQTVPLGRLYEAALRAPVMVSGTADSAYLHKHLRAVSSSAVAPTGTTAE